MIKPYSFLSGVLLLAIVAGSLSMLGCSQTAPKNLKDGCSIFREKDDWYEYMYDSYKKWGVPVHVQLAIIYQESRFKYDAKTPRGTLLWVIPWFRASSAYGYAQVKDGTWDWYKKSTGNRWADRDDFEDAVDFIGWYGSITYKKLGISKWDAYNQYLAYHEGHGGFKRKTYLKKPWLIKVARTVKTRASSYRAQLKRCEGDLDKGWSLWPF
ncbi:MAG: transglycosylase SLT domain-containing protein [Gammaproteobacteria bacterium]|nr:transglycosylase SLT domain-containing protein [Gammaproteobacteria bacterium]